MDDVDCYLRIHLGLPPVDALNAQQQMFERGLLVLHWREIDGPNAGQEGDISRGVWGRELRLARDSEIRGGVDYATQQIRVPCGEVFVQELAPSIPRSRLELTMAARDVRMQRWPAPQAGQKTVAREEEVQGEDTPLVIAIKKRIDAGHDPGVSERWERFCDKVRESIGVKESDWGYGDKSIERTVNELRESDKSDKSDMSDMS